MPKLKFNVDDIVYLMAKEGESREYDVSKSNPYWPSVDDNGAPIQGRVSISDMDNIFISWASNPSSDSWYPSKTKELHHYKDFKSTEKIKGVDLKALDKLVISDDKRRSIVAVLKQHQHADKIFKDWGLGGVIEYGKGMTMLFHGVAGTGKTWAANCIAEALGKKLEVMDNAKLQSSTPGEMERNIKNAFKEATTKKAILMFDECDSLIMSRQNVGMILGSEINCLLTEIEKFEGVCILTTNRIGELDEALERRISLIVKFPKPLPEQRHLIWKRFLPKKLPLAKDVDINELVTHELTGGLIKNVVLNAARMAVSEDREEVTMDDFRYAIKQTSQGTKAFDTPSATPRTVGTLKQKADITS